MQDDPPAATLLAAIADTLDRRVLPELSGAAQHHARVAANLCRILAREADLDRAADQRAARALADLLAAAPGDAAARRGDDSAATLWAELAERIDALPAGDRDTADGQAADAFVDAAHPVVLAVVRDKLAVARPDYADGGAGR